MGKVIQINLKYEVCSKFKPINMAKFSKSTKSKSKNQQTVSQIYKNLDFALPQQKCPSRANLGSFTKFS